MNPRRHLAAAEAFAHGLVVAAINRDLHPAGSRLVRESMQELVEALAAAERSGAPMPLELAFAADRIVYAGETLVAPSLQARSLLRSCRARGVATLSFSVGFDAAEADRLFDLLLLPNNADCFSPQHCDRVLTACGLRHVRIGHTAPNGTTTTEDADRRALRQYQDLAECLQQNHARALHDRELEVDATSHLLARTLSEFDEPSLLLSLATQDNVDRFTVGHSVRVALLALQVARAVGATREQLAKVGTAALLHDIGKSKVPQEVLFKRGKLNADEWREMQQHPRLGAQILLEQHTHVDSYTVGAAFCHHLGPDGRGYPGTTVPIRPSSISNLVRICDVFEALTAVRPYKQALSPIEAYAVMFRNESDFHPAWLRCFVRTLGLFPIGSRIELTDGALALVVGQTTHAERPRVRLLSGPAGDALAEAAPRDAIIGEAVEGRIARIGRVLMPSHTVEVPAYDADPAAATEPTVATACLGNCGDPTHRH
ncbi:MAG: hypothetical protein RL398_3557 [Planctomycetota bacterium]